ncbi:protein maternal effect lethal 26-like [Leptopilina boulardi]|uniref:protein maternal effect lethal 26-like n=1 Tax=Leptopilina boulardi TaxID=63433 RepID=UPI0021F58BE0|nr:protein maternal effect lethal 26-like [Leptopilina boulardi]
MNLLEEINFDWDIPNFIPHENYISNSFALKGSPTIKWFITVCATDSYAAYHNKQTSIHKFLLSNETKLTSYFQNPIEIKFILGIYPNTKIFTMTGMHILDFENIIKTKELNKIFTTNGFGINSLHVSLEITQLMKTNEKKSIDVDSISTLINNFKPFLINDTLSDVVFQINSKEFPAHKIVLASVSPVFEKMFTHQMKENLTNTVQINDADSDCFKEMLNYIYTGNVENLNTMAFGLYELANKYDISTLQTICEKCLIVNLAVDNAISIFQLADQYNNLNLKKKCIEYIDKNFTNVKKTETFKVLGRELLMELFCAIKN